MSQDEPPEPEGNVGRPRFNQPTVELDELDMVLLHSPLNLLAQFSWFMKDRFKQMPDVYMFDEDENQSQVYIGTSFERDANRPNAYPQIIVGRGQTVLQTVSLNQMSSVSPSFLKTEGAYRFGRGSTDLGISVTCQNYAEAELLGDIVLSSVFMSKQALEQEFTLLGISDSVVLGRVQPLNEEDTLYRCSVTFRVQYEVRWYNVPEGRPLVGVHLSMKHKEAVDAIKLLLLQDNSVTSS